MKKKILPILLFMIFIPFYVNAETCDMDKITISSITINDKSGNAEELEEVTASGKNINLNLYMPTVNDTIEYKIVVKNDSNSIYTLDKNSFNINSEYIDYTFKTEDDSNIIKSNSSKIVYLKIKYENIIPDNAFKTGVYNYNKTMKLQLSPGNTIINPKTISQFYILVLALIIEPYPLEPSGHI